MKIITCDMVSKSFHRHGGQVVLRQHLAYLFGRNRELDFHALKSVSFAVVEGEGLAVIGSNGAGKSTLLTLVAGFVKAGRRKRLRERRVDGPLSVGVWLCAHLSRTLE